MNTVFADTFFYLAILNPRDQAHGQAIAESDAFTGRIITTEWVLTELADALSDPAEREKVAGMISVLEQDKVWSLTDCISFTVMQERRLQLSWTGDHHFEQAGFTAVFRES
jgi:uncharacterized protein